MKNRLGGRGGEGRKERVLKNRGVNASRYFLLLFLLLSGNFHAVKKLQNTENTTEMLAVLVND